MIRVFFDDTEVNSNYIMKLTQTVNPYTQGFSLGSTICRQFSVDIHRDANVTMPDKVYLYEDNDSEDQSDWSLYATLFVDSVETAEDNHTSFNLTDIMVRFNTLLAYQGAVLDVLNQICTDKGITLNTQDLYLKDIEIGEVSINERDLISYVAEVNGGYAYIDNEGNLNICRYENKAYSNIDSDMCSTLRIGAYHKIGRVSYYASGSTEEYYPSSTDYDTVSLNPDNILLHDDSTRWIIMQHIYSLVRGFAFYNVKIEKCPIDPNIRAGQLINVGGWRNLISSGEEYITTLAGERILVSDGLLIPFLCEIDWNYNTQWLGGYNIELENKIQEETAIVTTQEKISQTRNAVITINKELGSINQEVEDLETNVRASLELKIDKDDNDQIISMINASADNIILNTKSLIFGVYPDGQYIEVKNKYNSSNVPIGVLFEGTGEVEFDTVRRFLINNYDSHGTLKNLFSVSNTIGLTFESYGDTDLATNLFHVRPDYIYLMVEYKSNDVWINNNIHTRSSGTISGSNPITYKDAISISHEKSNTISSEIVLCDDNIIVWANDTIRIYKGVLSVYGDGTNETAISIKSGRLTIENGSVVINGYTLSFSGGYVRYS